MEMYSPSPSVWRLHSAALIPEALKRTGLPAGPLGKAITLYRTKRKGSLLHAYAGCNMRAELQPYEVIPAEFAGKTCSRCRPSVTLSNESRHWMLVLENAAAARTELDAIRQFHLTGASRRASALQTARWLRGLGEAADFPHWIEHGRKQLTNGASPQSDELIQAALDVLESIEREGRALADELEASALVTEDVPLEGLAADILTRRVRFWSVESELRSVYGNAACQKACRTVETWRYDTTRDLTAFVQRTFADEIANSAHHERFPQLDREDYPLPWMTEPPADNPWAWIGTEWRARLGGVRDELTRFITDVQAELETQRQAPITLVVATATPHSAAQITGLGIADMLLALGASRAPDSSLWIVRTNWLVATWVKDKATASTVRLSFHDDLSDDEIAAAMGLWPSLPMDQRREPSKAITLATALAA